jgi:hypothetical protein
MGIFDILKKKEPTMVEGTIRYVINDDGDKYLHIDDFNSLLKEFKKSMIRADHKQLLDNIIEELNQA